MESFLSKGIYSVVPFIRERKVDRSGMVWMSPSCPLRAVCVRSCGGRRRAQHLLNIDRRVFCIFVDGSFGSSVSSVSVVSFLGTLHDTNEDAGGSERQQNVASHV